MAVEIKTLIKIDVVNTFRVKFPLKLQNLGPIYLVIRKHKADGRTAYLLTDDENITPAIKFQYSHELKSKKIK